MERHYILQTTMRLRDNEFMSPLGLVCTEDELNEMLKHAHVVSYRIKQIDDDPVENWQDSKWVSVR